MIKSKPEIISILEEELKTHSEIIFAYIFGSFIESENFNDIDIAIYINKEVHFDNPTGHEIQLSYNLQKKIGKPVDIILLNTAPDHLIHHISKGKLILDRYEDIRLDFILPAWKRYFDFKEKRKEFIKEILEEIPD